MSQPAVTSQQKATARLWAVQAVYQWLITGQDPRQIVENILEGAGEGAMVVDDPLVDPAGDLWRQIFSGTVQSSPDILNVIGNHLKNKTIDNLRDQEPLLLSVLLAGTYELAHHPDIDAPIILNDYMDVATAYFDGPEPKLINAILDAIKKLYRI